MFHITAVSDLYLTEKRPRTATTTKSFPETVHSFRSFENCFGDRSCCCDLIGPKIVEIRAVRKIFRPFEHFSLRKGIFEIQHDFIRETLIYLGVDYGLEIINWADIPTKGSGLGSSGSFLVGLLNAIHTLEGNHVSKEKLAQQASHIEMVLCGKPIGYQDQYAAAYGGLNEMKFTADNGHNIKVVPLIKNQDDLNSISQDLLLFYTGITRESSSVLSDQNKNLMNKEDTINAMKKNVDLSKWLAEHLRNKEYQ